MSNQVAEELVHELANVEAPTVRRGGKEMVCKAPVVRCGLYADGKGNCLWTYRYVKHCFAVT
jgi:hypothetical protein